MRYDEAIAAVKAGSLVRREHWHWVYLTFRSPKIGETNRRIYIIVDENGNETDRYTETKADRNATDWKIL